MTSQELSKKNTAKTPYQRLLEEYADQSEKLDQAIQAINVLSERMESLASEVEKMRGAAKDKPESKTAQFEPKKKSSAYGIRLNPITSGIVDVYRPNIEGNFIRVAELEDPVDIVMYSIISCTDSLYELFAPCVYNKEDETAFRAWVLSNWVQTLSTNLCTLKNLDFVTYQDFIKAITQIYAKFVNTVLDILKSKSTLEFTAEKMHIAKRVFALEDIFYNDIEDARSVIFDFDIPACLKVSKNAKANARNVVLSYAGSNRLVNGGDYCKIVCAFLVSLVVYDK